MNDTHCSHVLACPLREPPHKGPEVFLAVGRLPFPLVDPEVTMFAKKGVPPVPQE